MISNKIPEAFILNMQTLLGEEESQTLLHSLDQDAPTSIRLSQVKGDLIPSSMLLKGVVPWCPWGYYLSERPLFTSDPLFHAGAYYVQEASSMLLYQIKPLLGDKPLVALDLCAAPGGKSSLLLDLLPKDSLLVSNEIVKHRANILLENLLKWGNPRSIVTSTSPSRLGKARNLYDLILVDAPCSGEGMFRKDTQAREEWSPNSPSTCAERQRAILNDIWPSLNEDGLLIYSTCTMNREENEDIVQFILDDLGADAIDLGKLPGGVWSSPFSSSPCYRMLPHRVEGEGLFFAVFRKTSTDTISQHNKASKNKKGYKEKSNNIPAVVRTWIDGDQDYSLFEADSTIYAETKKVQLIRQELSSLGIDVLSSGIPLATIKGKDCIPHAGLALSTCLKTTAFPRAELSLNQALSFLSRESIILDDTTPKGFVLVCFRETPLGFVKHLGNRSNNLYPPEWRIRNLSKVLEAVHEE